MFPQVYDLCGENYSLSQSVDVLMEAVMPWRDMMVEKDNKEERLSTMVDQLADLPNVSKK